MQQQAHQIWPATAPCRGKVRHRDQRPPVPQNTPACTPSSSRTPDAADLACRSVTPGLGSAGIHRRIPPAATPSDLQNHHVVAQGRCKGGSRLDGQGVECHACRTSSSECAVLGRCKFQLANMLLFNAGSSSSLPDPLIGNDSGLESLTCPALDSERMTYETRGFWQQGGLGAVTAAERNQMCLGSSREQ